MTCSPEAYHMRDQLLHAFRFAFRKDPMLLSRVSWYCLRHRDHSDMILYLNELAVLGKTNTEYLSAMD